MTRLTRYRGHALIAFGAVLLNTMPIWLAEMAGIAGIGTGATGLLASLILLVSAVACHGHLGARSAGIWQVCVAALVAGLGLLAAIGSAPAWAVFGTGAIIGAALGTLMAGALAELSATPDPTTSIGRAVGVALLVSLLCLVLVPVLGGRIVPVLALGFLALAPFVWRPADTAAGPVPRLSRSLAMSHLHLLPFFVAMGGYWAYLEVFAQNRGLGAIVGWLAVSLVVSAAGSALAGVVAPKNRGAVASGALVLAALSGGLTYLAFTGPLFGLALLINAFFLFLFLPLYLGAPSPRGGRLVMPMRMATYLLGFALGGMAAAAIVATAGFTALALAIAITAIGAIRPV